MLTIYNIETLSDIKMNVNKRKTKKTQIFLYDTQRRMEDFTNKLKYRNNGTYKDVPHFIISKLGHIYQIFDTNHSSVTFGDSKVDNRLIKVAIENLGWLNKNTINGFLFNWIGDPYRAEPCVKVWRGRYYWDKYTDEQMKSIFELSNFLFEKHKIKKKIVPSQGFLQNIQNFDGIVCKSNFSDIYTDINPSFNFRLFNNGEQTDIKLRSNKKDVKHIKET